MHGTYRSGEVGKSLLRDARSELQLGGSRTRRAKVISGMGKKNTCRKGAGAGTELRTVALSFAVGRLRADLSRRRAMIEVAVFG